MIKQLPVEFLYLLRNSVLRPGRPIESCQFDGDLDAQTRHFAYEKDSQIMAIASTYVNARNDLSAGWQLRGMASAASMRGQGLGKLLLDAIIECAQANKAPELWCNARQGAIGFYENAGFTVHSELFDIVDVGPHVVMAKNLSAS